MPFHSKTIDRATLRIGGTLTLTALDASLFIASRAEQGSRWLGGIRCCQIQGENLSELFKDTVCFFVLEHVQRLSLHSS